MLNGALLPGVADDALGLADVTVFLPTQRAVRALRHILAGQRASLIMPEILPLGRFEDSNAENADPAQAVHAHERLLFLVGLIAAWKEQMKAALPRMAVEDHYLLAGTLFDQFSLAGELTRLFDTLIIHGVSPDAIEKCVPPEHDDFWQLTQKFLTIATRAWPDHIEALGMIDPMQMRQDTIRRFIAAIETNGGTRRIIIAGSTGSQPATARLMRALVQSGKGCVVLPGLDRHTPDFIFDSFAAGGGEPNHPQFMLARTIRTIGVSRSAVTVLGSADRAMDAREQLAAFSQFPADHTVEWRGHDDMRAAILDDALDNCAIIEAADEEQEAKSIACAMRETAQDPARTAALVTNDRLLAERVKAVLARWQLTVQDSAGAPLGQTRAGALATLIADWMAEPLSGESIIALLAHEDVLLGIDRARIVQALAPLEMSVFRGRVPCRSWQEILACLAQQRDDAEKRREPQPVRLLAADDWDAALAAISNLQALAQPLPAPRDNSSLRALVDAHCDLIRAVIAGPQPADESSGDYAAITENLCDVTRGVHTEFPACLADYQQILPFLLNQATTRPAAGGNPNLKIWGLLEARLLTADRMILAGLNDLSWPSQARNDPFLTRTTRKALGLPLPEESIGQEAHDFVQAFVNSADVIVSRALKKDGAPTIPSRFFQRLSAYCGDHASLLRAKMRGSHYLHYAASLDHVDAARPAARPQPVPKPELMPERISVTEVETLLRDPYAIYARRILGLEALAEWNAPVDYALRGQMLHALAAFVAEIPGTADELRVAWQLRASAMMEEFDIPPELRTFWLPQFTRIGAWFAEWHRQRASMPPALRVEKRGALRFSVADGYDVLLSGIADRIERTADGIAIIDFKSGAVPTAASVHRGLSPQLTLEAAMARDGAFGADLAGLAPQELIYVSLTANRKGCTATDVLVGKNERFDGGALAEKHVRALQQRLRAHHAGHVGFRSKSFPAKILWESDYDHLARVAEWSRGGDDEADDE